MTRPLEDNQGQATVEFALVAVAFLSLVVACTLLWRALKDGLFVEHALISASHHISKVSLGVIGDVFLY